MQICTQAGTLWIAPVTGKGATGLRILASTSMLNAQTGIPWTSKRLCPDKRERCRMISLNCAQTQRYGGELLNSYHMPQCSSRHSLDLKKVLPRWKGGVRKFRSTVDKLTYGNITVLLTQLIKTFCFKHVRVKWWRASQLSYYQGAESSSNVKVAAQLSRTRLWQYLLGLNQCLIKNLK